MNGPRADEGMPSRARDVIFERDAVVLGGQSALSSAHHGARVQVSAIREVRCDRFPPELVLTSGEVLFVAKREQAALDLFARVHAIPRALRHDVWADLLEPFLDTEFSAEEQARTLERLIASGLSRPEIDELRDQVAAPMLGYNALLWDWFHLGHYDLLAAMAGALSPEQAAAFYPRSMEIANRGQELPAASSLTLEDQLRLRWYDLEQALGAPIGSTQPLFQEILARYAEPHRVYHDQHHLLAVVSAVASAALDETDRTATLLSAWFHDVVYQPGAGDNEVASAALMAERIAAHAHDTVRIEQAAELIRGTARPLVAGNAAARVLADADLAILAEEDAIYRRYAAAIRAEYASFDDPAFRAGRIGFLKEVQAAQRARGLFHTLHPLHEALARDNIERELERLARAGLPNAPP